MTHWTALVDPHLLRIFRSIRLLGSSTPSNAAEERERLTLSLRQSSAENPRWRYVQRSLEPEILALAQIRTALTTEPETPLVLAYLARIDEMALECGMVESVGTPRFRELATKRFPCQKTEADPLAAEWLTEGPAVEEEPTIMSDSNDPGSLLSQMRRAVGASKLPFRVTAHASLAALAATGEESIVVASGRMLTVREIQRTVVHEVQGHAEPRVRSRSTKVGLFTFGTARGSDEQEGLALLFEDEAAMLDPTRRRQLSARHHATRWMADGAEFREVVAKLVSLVGVSAEAAVRIGERAFRGGDGEGRGLGRDSVYLESLLRVRGAAAEGDTEVLAKGQVATEWVHALRDHS